MKTSLLCALAITFGLSVAAQAPKPTSQQQCAESNIRESEAQWAESVATGDTTAIQRILADDFIGTDPNGELYDKAKMIADTKDAPKHFVSNHLDQIKISRAVPGSFSRPKIMQCNQSVFTALQSDEAGNVIETHEHNANSRSGSAIKQPNLKGNRDF